MRTGMIGTYTYKRSIFVSEGHARWTLKHCVNTSGMFAGLEYSESGLLVGVPSIHPTAIQSSCLIRCREGWCSIIWIAGVLVSLAVPRWPVWGHLYCMFHSTWRRQHWKTATRCYYIWMLWDAHKSHLPEHLSLEDMMRSSSYSAVNCPILLSHNWIWYALILFNQ